MIKQKWECHKTVEAFKIIDVEGRPSLTEGNKYLLIGKDGQGEVVDREWVIKLAPPGSLMHASVFIGGYFVRYADGYTSWSPAGSFEPGYTELKDENSPS